MITFKLPISYMYNKDDDYDACSADGSGKE